MKGLKPGHVPLERALSKLGLASRTQARELIQAGKVRVNGTLRTQPGFPVNPEKAKIEIDGKLAANAEWRTFMLHKPRGVVTTRADEKGRATAFELMSETGIHLGAVGRLDQATSGLLLFTNDTRLSDWLTNPKYSVLRSYLVTVRGEVTEDDLSQMKQGIQDEGELLKASEVKIRKASRKESHLLIQLSEGKNREIRRMLAALGNEVTRLKRVAFGGLELGELEAGEFREVSEEELLQAFPGAPLRGKKA